MQNADPRDPPPAQLATALFGFVAIFAVLGLDALALLAERRLEQVGNRV